MITVATFYRFASMPDYRALKAPLDEKCRELGIRGTILLASEGINATIAGGSTSIEALLAFLRRDARFSDLQAQMSEAEEMPFRRLKVRLKKEIVTMGIPAIDPEAEAGTYVEPADWNELISDPDVLLIDTRNGYEVAIGTFEGAVNPETDSFRQFPSFVDQHLDPERHRRVAMFCTGGIRCEKATAYLRRRGFGDVYHLKGGILNYIKSTEPAESRWKGECFVFDDRIALNHALENEDYVFCSACQHPLSVADRQTEEFVEGESCPYCP